MGWPAPFWKLLDIIGAGLDWLNTGWPTPFWKTASGHWWEFGPVLDWNFRPKLKCWVLIVELMPSSLSSPSTAIIVIAFPTFFWNLQLPFGFWYNFPTPSISPCSNLLMILVILPPKLTAEITLIELPYSTFLVARTSLKESAMQVSRNLTRPTNSPALFWNPQKLAPSLIYDPLWTVLRDLQWQTWRIF